MKKNLLIMGCIALSAHAFSQTTLFSEDFENGDQNWTMNLTGIGSNEWRVNASYNGNAGASIPNVPNQPAAFVNSPQSLYMHILNVPNCGGFVPVTCNANYNPADTSNRYTEMSGDISTLNATNVSFNFWFLCGGEQDESYGNVEYSIDGGTSWNVVGPDLYNTYAWTAQSITDPAFDNQATLRFAFHWRNVNSGTNPSLGVDEITIVGDVSSDITMQHLNATIYCPGASDAIGFEALGTYNTGNVFTAQLSDATGSFTSPTAIGTLASTSTGILSIPGTFPVGTTAGTAYRVRVVSSDPVIIGTDNGEDVTFLALPTISVETTPANGTICEGTAATLTASGATTYSWLPSGTLSSATGATVTATPPATITYTVTGSEFEGCTNTQTVTITVEDCAGINENTTAQLRVYPNPANDEIHVQFAVNAGVSLVEILDQSGRIIRSINWNVKNVNTDLIDMDMNVSDLEAGSYIVRLTHAGGNEITRFTKN